ncbi:MAG: Gfo/Idh/MocA family oxidoreductase [Clostridia bacterium]|nr:Gfo/Idh/MocA family oxidoreductase [Clostridia bacterium]
MDQRMLKVGVIGMGQMGTEHARVYRKLPFTELTAVCERDDDRRAAAHEAFGCPAHKDYLELLSNPDIDAVSIVLPDNLHRPCVEEAIRQKKHILLEKPLAHKLEDARALYELAKGYEKVFTVGFLLRFDARFSAVKSALDSGELGEVVHICCRRNSPITGPRRYIGASDLSMHVMVHDIDYLNWFMGAPPVTVFAKARSVMLREHGMNDVIYALLTYGNGVIACLEACWTLPENAPTIIDDQVELVGTKGVAYIDACDKGVRFITGQRVRYPDSRHWFDVNGQPAGDLLEEILAFARCALDGGKPCVSVEEAYHSLRVVDAIERSLATGAEISL